MATENLNGVGDYVKYGVLKLFVFLTYIISHIYDYVTYPFYFIYYHPWLVRQYKKSDHARREDREDCIVFHSLYAPTALNVTMERNGLDTMDKVFDYVSKFTSFLKMGAYLLKYLVTYLINESLGFLRRPHKFRVIIQLDLTY